METVQVARLDSHTAAQLLAGLERHDPRGIATAADLQRMTERGACFAATHHSGAQAVYVINVRNGQAWVEACQGSGAVDFTRTLLPAIELQAAGLTSVGFQTARPGLVRKAERLGYHVTGWIMKKELPCCNQA